MNSFFGMFMESYILRVSCKVNVKPEASLTLQETQSIHDSMNIPKIECISQMNDNAYLNK